MEPGGIEFGQHRIRTEFTGWRGTRYFFRLFIEFFLDQFGHAVTERNFEYFKHLFVSYCV